MGREGHGAQRRDVAPDSIHQRYYVSWLDSQQSALTGQFIALDGEQEHVVGRDLGQMRALEETAAASHEILDEMVNDFRADYKYDGEKVGLELARLREESESEAALRQLEASTVLKQKQEALHEGAFVQLRAALEDLHKQEELRLERTIAFRGDEQGLERERLPLITAVLRNPAKVHAHFDQEKWLDMFRSQPWLAQQEIEEAKRRETFDKKKMQLAQMAGIVEQKREDMIKESAELEAMEAAMLENDRIRGDEEATKDDVARSPAERTAGASRTVARPTA